MAEKEIVKEPSSNDDSDEVDDPDEIPEISSDESDLEESETQPEINKRSSASKNNSVTKSKIILIIKFVKKSNCETNFVNTDMCSTRAVSFLWKRKPLKVLHDSKLILNDQWGRIQCGFKNNLGSICGPGETRRTSRTLLVSCPFLHFLTSIAIMALQ